MIIYESNVEEISVHLYIYSMRNLIVCLFRNFLSFYKLIQTVLRLKFQKIVKSSTIQRNVKRQQ